jgi:hypothetical protein
MRVVLLFAALAGGCYRTTEFGPTEVERLRPLAHGATTAAPSFGAEVVSGLGEAVGVVEPARSVVLYGEREVEVEGDTELQLLVGEESHDFRPAALVFGPETLRLHGQGSLKVPYRRITGLEHEEFSFAYTALWTLGIAGGGLLVLVVVALAVGDGNGGGGGGDFD